MKNNKETSNNELLLQNLGSTDDDTNVLQDVELATQYDYEKEICQCFVKKYNQFTCESVISIIKKIPPNNRLMYAKISSFIFNLSEKERDRFFENVTTFQEKYAQNLNGTDDTVYRFAVKICDHCQLANYQIEMSAKKSNSVAQELNKQTEQFKTGIRDELKGIEKEYITILGIFSSVVLAFIGGISFSSAVLESIDSVSKFRLVFIVSLLGLILFDTISLLLVYIWKITQSKEKKEEDFLSRIWLRRKKISNVGKWIIRVNIIFAIIAVGTFLAWGIENGYILNFLYKLKEFLCIIKNAIIH